MALRSLSTWALRTVARCAGGNVSIIAALAIPVVVAVLALGAEYGHGVVVKAENQRAADLAAYAGAIAYNASSSTDRMNAAVDQVGVLNGISADDISATLMTSPTGSGNQAVRVTVSTILPLYLAEVVGGTTSLPVAATAFAELKADAPGCIIALNAAGSGVTLSGGTSVSASACAVASNATVTVPCGTTITTVQVAYNSASAPSQPCTGITAPLGKTLKITKVATTDPLVSYAGVTTATGRIATVAAVNSPSAPTAPAGQNLDLLPWAASTAQTQLSAIGCSGSVSGSTFTITCAGAGPFNIGTVTVGGGTTVNFNTSGSTAAVYNFSSNLNVGGGVTVNFGPGTFTFAQGLQVSGGSTATFGAGTFKFGLGPSCNGASGYSLCNSASLSFGGPSTFVMAGGIYNGGGATLTLGAGTSNSFDIGKAGDGNAFFGAGGAKTTFADATGAASLFRMAGRLNIASGGGSCLTVSAADQHDINGDLLAAGGVTLGSGIYTVNGAVGFGASGGGNVTCNGVTVGLNAPSVTLVISGVTTISGGSCNGLSFCVGAGYSNVVLTAPSSGTMAKLAVVGPTSNITAGAAFAEGASSSISGAFYFPKGPVSLSGGASVGSGSGQCLELIGSQVSLSGGTTAASTCISAGASGGSVVLVQ